MTHRVVFRPDAKADLQAMYRYIAGNAGRTVAAGYLQRIQDACRSLETFPMRGTPRDDLGSGLRQVGFEKRASILFRVGDGTVEIVGIAYGGRDLDSLFGDRNQ